MESSDWCVDGGHDGESKKERCQYSRQADGVWGSEMASVTFLRCVLPTYSPVTDGVMNVVTDCGWVGFHLGVL